MKVELQKKPDQVWSTLYHRFCETYGNVQTNSMAYGFSQFGTPFLRLEAYEDEVL